MYSGRTEIFQVALFILITASLLGCQLPELSPPSQPLAEVPFEAPEPGSITEASTAESDGRLAYLGADGNIYVTTADRRATIAVTDDATAPPEGQGLSYHRVAWSRDGRLAFAAVTRFGNDAQSTLYVAESPTAPAQAVGHSDTNFVIYIFWAPAPCVDRPDCQRLAYLIGEGGDIALRMVEMQDEASANQLLDTARPFYFSWSSDGRQMLWHTDNEHLAIYDLEHGQTKLLPNASGAFLAPAWSPREDRWLGVERDKDVDRVQSYDNFGAAIVAASPRYDAAFVWSPEGDQIAYAVQERRIHSFFGPIRVHDVETGQSRRVTDVGFRILAFFWSPDGQRLGYLTHLPIGNSVWMQWRVYDLERDEDRGFAVFDPSPQMRYMIQSFNQYAQSHRFWSPDSRYLVYADRDRAQVDRVWLIDTWAEKGADPILIDRGTMGVWSWE